MEQETSPGNRSILSVSEINALMNRLLAKQPLLCGCWVSGEIAAYKHHQPSGHCYFTLKDQQAAIKAVMFRTWAAKVPFQPHSGMQVLVHGNVRLYERDGSIQLYVDQMQPSGIGALYLAFEDTKARLAEEGLTDPRRRRPIPKFPERIGIITSPTGAALQDIIRIARRRNPHVALLLIPSAVQGEAAPQELVRALQRAGHYGRCDVLIIGRGGGSMEELWAFNDERVARAIASSPTPTISAVGHEIDVTIADLVADLRAPTPSAAAELAVPLAAELRLSLQGSRDRLQQRLSERIGHSRRELELLRHRPGLADPYGWLQQRQQRLNELEETLGQKQTGFMDKKNDILSVWGGQLNALSPLAVLGRGYSLTHEAGGRLLRSVEETEVGAEIEVRLIDGSLECRVEAVRHKDALPGGV